MQRCLVGGEIWGNSVKDSSGTKRQSGTVGFNRDGGKVKGEKGEVLQDSLAPPVKTMKKELGANLGREKSQARKAQFRERGAYVFSASALGDLGLDSGL